jgi:hypothetical protein
VIMAVKIRRKIEAMGGEFEATIYLPEDLLLTKERREKADKLDSVLKAEVGNINMEYESLDEQTKNSEIKKWRWLGEKLDFILRSVELIEQSDLDNHNIWPAIGQHLRKELSRGLDDKKRSGTKKDHYRKCWALYTTPGTDWITSWVGWDAFTDRGEQLVYSKRLMPLLGARFSSLAGKLGADDFKEIAKLTVKYIPTQAKTPKDIDSMPETTLVEIAKSIYHDFSKAKGNNP